MLWFPLLLTVFSTVFAQTHHAHSREEASTCGKPEAPLIKFPFWMIKEENTSKPPQPHSCTTPSTSFRVSCTKQGGTVLDSLALSVRSIDYESRLIHLEDPHGGCLPKRLLPLNLSASSPFHSYYGDAVLFTCPSTTPPMATQAHQAIPCLSSGNHTVYAIPSDFSIMNLPLLNCKRCGSVPDTSDEGVLLEWTEPDCPHSSKGISTKLKVTGAASASFVLLLIIAVVLYRRYSVDKAERQHRARIAKCLEDYRALKPTRYSYADIKRITDQFKHKLGQGGFGTVFKGKLSNDIFVAVKILNNAKGDGEEFINEVGTMGRIHHVNIVRLVGFCADGFRKALVYDFLPNESLEKFIFSENIKKALGWKKLKDIALGTAKGIEYLHQGCEQQILHFDIKPHNILLDQNFNAKISDFGLAKLCSKDQSAVSMTAARGTIGYIAPEVFSRNFGSASHKSDVYSFGMSLLDMVEGRRNGDLPTEDCGESYFPDWIYNRLEHGQVIGNGIDTATDASIAKQLTIVGLWCIRWHPTDRPSMKAVVEMLQAGDSLKMPPNPFSSTNPSSSGTITHGGNPNSNLTTISELVSDD